MFKDGTKALHHVMRGKTPKGVLKQFCFYRWDGTGERVFPSDPDVFAASVDCPAVRPMGPTVPVDGLEKAMLTQAGRPQGVQLSGSAPVTVTIVDTGSSAAAWKHGGRQTRDHGGAMQRIVEAVVDGDISTTRALALPLRSSDGTPADPEGADYGTRGHLAIGIVEAVEQWRRRVAQDKTKRLSRLVLNLSVGWVTNDGEEAPWQLQGSTTSATLLKNWLNTPKNSYDNQAAVESVHAALLYASCHGALVVASAGNRNPGSKNPNPVAPAAWAQYPAPSDDECAALGFFASPVNEGGPILLPVSAIDSAGLDILATRANTRTRLVAPGFYGVARPENPRAALGVTPPSLQPLTGTSVAAALVSGAAALVWSHNPKMPRGDVVRHLYNTGRDTGRDWELVQFDGPSGQSDPRSRSLCLVDALSSSGRRTASTAAAPLCTGAGYADVAANMAGTSVATLVTTPDCRGWGQAGGTPPRCNLKGASRGPDDLAGPQPHVGICVDCPIQSGTQAAATLELDQQYTALVHPDGVQADGMLHVWVGSTRTDYLIDGATTTSLNRGDRVRVTLGQHPTIDRAEVEFLVHEGGDQYWRSSQLRVLP